MDSGDGMLSRRFLALAALAAGGCASGGQADLATLASNSDQLIWEAGQKAAEKKRWESARQHFRRIIDGFPQSRLGPAARLALADAYFNERGMASYILAVSAYREFLTFYPSHEQSAYAQFQVGESFFRQRNPPDRDQTATIQALGEFQRLLELRPDSSHMEAARERVVELRNTLARAEFQVGFFYQRTRKAYRAAITRYEGILTDYPDFTELDLVLLRLAECLSLSSRPAEAAPYAARLLEEYPESPHAEKAQTLLTSLPESVPAPETPPPSPPEPAPQPQVSL